MATISVREQIPEWEHPREAVTLLIQGVTAPLVWRTAFAVGTFLVCLNYGATIVAGEASPTMWVRALLNYAVPFTTASIATLLTRRVERED